jgi:integrase
MPHRTSTSRIPLLASSLRDAALAPATRRAYQLNLDKFLLFTRLPLPQLLLLRSKLIDQRFSAYLESEFAARASFHNATHAFFGLLFASPRLKHKLGESRLRLRGWRRLITHRSHPPITWELTVLFASVMAKWGYHSEAVGTLLSFECYLRVGELTRLRYSDIVQPNDPRTGAAHTRMALRLAHTKTGPNQWVSVRSQSVEAVLLYYLRAYPFLSSSLVFPFTPSTFRRLLSRVALSLGLGDIPYVPHSFRHGGATSDFLQGCSIEQIMFRGRWVSMESARRYIQMSRALLIMLRIPAHLNSTGALLAHDVPRSMQLLMESVRIRKLPATPLPRGRVRWRL